jgi:hypothetical protein
MAAYVFFLRGTQSNCVPLRVPTPLVLLLYPRMFDWYTLVAVDVRLDNRMGVHDRLGNSN